MRSRTTSLGLLLAVCFAISASAAEGRILKVLPHLLDNEGRQSLSPSLFERDAYQSHLRRTPSLVSGVQFDVQWKAPGTDASKLKLRLEVIGSKGSSTKPHVIELVAKPGRFGSTWSALTLDKAAFKETGEVSAWRVSLWEGDTLLAEQKSFVW